MARGSTQATSAANTGLGFANQGGATLMPELQRDIVAPQGMNPVDLAREKTSNMQAAGGTQAAATGQGGLLAARTKNPGGAAAAIGEGARSAGEQLSKRNLDVENSNTLLKEKQREGGERGLENLTLGGLGAVAPNVNANTGAANESWDWAKFILDPTLAAAGKAAGVPE